MLDEDWTHINANLLMGIFYHQLEWMEMSRKHFAIAKVKWMRDLGLLPPKSNQPKTFRTQAREYRMEVVDYKKVKTTDEKISDKENDLMFFELIDFLVNSNVLDISMLALEYIRDKRNRRYFITQDRVRIMLRTEKDLLNVVNDKELEKWLEHNPND